MNLSINSSIELLGMNVTVSNPVETIIEATRLSAKVLEGFLDEDGVVDVDEMQKALFLTNQVTAMMVESDSN